MKLVDFAVDRLRLYVRELGGLGQGKRVEYVLSKLRSLGDTFWKGAAFRNIARELNQREVYQANLLALDRYRRKPLSGRLRALEIFETARSGAGREREAFDWTTVWQGKTVRHRVSGKDSGDMLSGANARVLAVVVAERLRAARDLGR